MNLFRSLMLALMMTTLTSAAYGAQVTRNLSNTDAANSFMITGVGVSGITPPNRQMFLNNLDFANSIWLQVGGQMTVATNTITFTLYDGCGNLVTQKTKVFDNTGLTTPTSKKWVEVALGSVPLVYNAYYYFDFKIENYQVKFVGNADRFVQGTLTSADAPELIFPHKKKDVTFILSGTTDSSKVTFPMATTNIACQNRCILANPSAVENVSYGPDRQFNVLIRETTPTVNGSMGSFWNDQTAGTISLLKQEIAAMLEGTGAAPGLRETYPYNNYSQASGQPFYYPQMNFYIAIEDPAVDVPSPNGDGARGFHHCANIDVGLEVLTAYPNPGFGGAPGKMMGQVNRPAPSSGGWGASMRSIAVHEVFGHAVPALMDEYVGTAGTNPYQVSTMANGFVANGLPISTGCTEWCGGTQPVSWLVAQMAADRDAACWSKTTQATCDSPGGFAVCRWIGGLPPIPYWGSYQCIPANAALYSIGTNCPAFGNHGCFPLGPRFLTNKDAIMDIVQPGGFIMQSGHAWPSAPGFTSHVETHIKDMLDCVFPVMPCQATQSRCTALAARYGTVGSGYKTFLEKANACEGGFVRRR